MKKFIYLAICFLPLVIFAQKAQDVKSEIKEVTVYLEGAIVERSANVTLNAGTTELLFRGLPEGLTKELITVKTNGAVRLLEVNYRNLTPEERGIQSVAFLQDGVQKSQRELALLKTKKSAREADLNFLNTKTLYKNQDAPTPQQFKEMDAYFAARREALLLETHSLSLKISELEQKLQKDVSEIHRITNNNLMEEKALALKVEAKQAGRFAFDLSYYTAQAGWAPNYNIRVDRLDAPVTFEMVAQVDQASGEDWSNVKLTLSTGNPTLGGQIPAMQVWTLMQSGGYIPRKNSVKGFRSRSGTGGVFGYVQEAGSGLTVPFATVRITGMGVSQVATSDASGNVRFDNLPEGSYQIQAESLGYNTYSSTVYVGRGRVSSVLMRMGGGAVNLNYEIGYAAPQTRKEQRLAMASDMSDVEIASNSRRGGRVSGDAIFVDLQESEEQFTTMQYAIAQSYTILANGVPVSIPINSATIPASFTHIVRPALDDNAFLVGKIVNWQDLRLLKAKTHLFFEGVYMGESVIDPLQTADTLQLSLGRDPQIVVKRERINRKQATSLFGGTQKHTFEYKIEVRNNKRLPINLVLEDQLPLSGNKEISVNKPTFSAGGSVGQETGYLTWRKTLAPGTMSEFNFGFEVSFPSSWRINLPY